jgi:hypothetical protein
LQSRLEIQENRVPMLVTAILIDQKRLERPQLAGLVAWRTKHIKLDLIFPDVHSFETSYQLISQHPDKIRLLNIYFPRNPTDPDYPYKNPNKKNPEKIKTWRIRS